MNLNSSGYHSSNPFCKYLSNLIGAAVSARGLAGGGGGGSADFQFREKYPGDGRQIPKIPSDSLESSDRHRVFLVRKSMTRRHAKVIRHVHIPFCCFGKFTKMPFPKKEIVLPKCPTRLPIKVKRRRWVEIPPPLNKIIILDYLTPRWKLTCIYPKNFVTHIYIYIFLSILWWEFRRKLILFR